MNDINTTSMRNKTSQYPVVCFGEILWDILPTGKVPGGAPLNVAYHLKKLGINTALVTKVGDDGYGSDLVNVMTNMNLATDFVQKDVEQPTGIVMANIGENHEMVYHIKQPAAWDYIQMEETLVDLVSQANYFVFGTLATREEASRNTLLKLLEHAKCKVLDVNLRPPFYSQKTIEQLLNGIHLLKINLAELELITNWFTRLKSENDRIDFLQERFKIPNIMVTKGAEGSVFNSNGILYKHSGYSVNVADTVGAGDASLAGLIAKLLQGKNSSEALQYSSALGALVAGCQGACPDYDILKIECITSFKQ